jgi:pilus assembly protein CpaD
VRITQTPSADAPSSRPAKVAGSLAALLLLSTFAAGCATTAQTDTSVAHYDYRQRHPIMISEEPEVLDIPVGMNGPAMSPEIEAAIDDYVGDYQRHGTGNITIQVPTASANEVAATKTGQAAHYALVRAGVPHANIQIAPYYVGDHAKTASMRLSFLRVKAVTPKCGLWPETAPNDTDNRQYHNLGCASQQNLAAMVANPADLVRPRSMEPANGARRAGVIKTYQDIGNTGWQPEPEGKLLDLNVPEGN